MKQQIAKWLLTNILMPVFRVILIEFAIIILKYLLDLVIQQMEKWKKNEEAAATSDEEKAGVIKRWDERITSIEALKAKVASDMHVVVDEALKKSNGKIIEIESNSVKGLPEAAIKA